MTDAKRRRAYSAQKPASGTVAKAIGLWIRQNLAGLTQKSVLGGVVLPELFGRQSMVKLKFALVKPEDIAHGIRGSYSLNQVLEGLRELRDKFGFAAEFGGEGKWVVFTSIVGAQSGNARTYKATARQYGVSLIANGQPQVEQPAQAAGDSGIFELLAEIDRIAAALPATPANQLPDQSQNIIKLVRGCRQRLNTITDLLAR